jgi:hypothetical protein
LALIPIGISILVISYIGLNRNLSKSLYNGLIFLIISLALATPYYLITYFLTGNPIFPFYNAVFKSPFHPQVNAFINFKDSGMGYGLRGLIQLPWNLTYFSESFMVMEGEPGGLLGIVFLIPLPFIFLIWPKLSEVIKLLAFTTAMFLGIWFVIGQYLRYILPIFPSCALMAGLTLLYFKDQYHSKYLNQFFYLIVLTVLLATIPISLVSLWNIPERIPYKVALGLETPDDYLLRVVRSYSVTSYLNKHYDSDKIRVLLIAQEHRFYLNAPAENPNTSLNLKKDFFRISTPEELTVYLKKKGFTHILIDTVSAPVTSKYALNIINKEFLRIRAKLEFSHNKVELYKLM